MTTTQEKQDVLYEIRVWDYDGAPDGDGYYLVKWVAYSDLRTALDTAYLEVRSYAVGARVYCNGEEIRTFGFVPE